MENEKENISAGKFPPRNRRQPKLLEDYVIDEDFENINGWHLDYCYKVSNIPKTYEEAIESVDDHKWKKAMDEEINALKENNTYEPTPLPENRSVVGGRWVYAIKLGPNDDER